MTEPYYKSKLSVNQAINKSFILWGIKPQTNRIYYKYELETRQKPVKVPCTVIDYQNEKREWLIFYVTENKLYSCTIDDITGSGNITSFNS